MTNTAAPSGCQGQGCGQVSHAGAVREIASTEKNVHGLLAVLLDRLPDGLRVRNYITIDSLSNFSVGWSWRNSYLGSRWLSVP